MQKRLVSDLKNGMITAEDVLSLDGQLVVPKGVALTDNLIARLFSFDVFSILIEDEQLTSTIDDLLESPSPSASYVERMKASPEFREFKEEFKAGIEKMHFSLNALVEKNTDFDPNDLLTDTMAMVNNRTTPSSVMDMILHMHEFDDDTYAHSLNVGMLCNIFARWMRFSEEERELATACGLFHDVGKLAMPADIIKKPGKLTPAEYRLIKTHPLESYKILSNYQFPDEVKNAALMHHERCDGSGYPYGFTSEKITRFAKLVAIADVYDAMTSNRSYREAMCPFTVIKYFEDDGLQRYDPGFLMTFLENTVNTFLNQRVKLSNGLEGDIIFINPIAYSKPTVKIGDKFIDLKKVGAVDIVDVI